MTEHITFPKPEPRVKVKHRARLELEAAKREAYRLVDLRDGKRCRACGRRCRSTMECVPDRLEHHHHPFRSLGGRHTTGELVTLCLTCHVEAQQHRLVITGHPDGVLTFSQDDREWTS